MLRVISVAAMAGSPSFLSLAFTRSRICSAKQRAGWLGLRQVAFSDFLGTFWRCVEAIYKAWRHVAKKAEI